MDTAQNYFDAWLKTQTALFDGFIENAKRTQQMFLSQCGPAGVGGEFGPFYASWAKALSDSMALAGSGDANALKDTLAKLLGGSNAYLKLYEIWLPLLKAVSDKSLNPAAYQQYVNPAQYKEMLDKIFGFDPDAVKLMIDQGSQLLALSTGSAQQFAKPWTEAANASLGSLPEFAQGHPEAFLKIFHSLFNAFDNTFGRVFHMPPVGKDREKIELLLHSLDDVSVYAAKYTEYQHIMYFTGLAAMEKVVEKLAEKLRLGEEIQQFDEFFDLWVDVSEQAYFKLFQTEDFARLQGELLDAGLKVRTRFFKIMEMQLHDVPVVLRSEMDDLYKTVYDLRKKVKKLEQQLKESAP
jgi:class III poly(R)-hydroxyalkanoic acid synthase PhaE subunit